MKSAIFSSVLFFAVCIIHNVNGACDETANACATNFASGIANTPADACQLVETYGGCLMQACSNDIEASFQQAFNVAKNVYCSGAGGSGGTGGGGGNGGGSGASDVAGSFVVVMATATTCVFSFSFLG